ncbi:MAG: sulfurtransferase [Cyanobacteria bacterium J06621_11]
MDNPTASTPAALVDVQWLHKQRNHSNLIIIDTRFSLVDPQQGRRQYEIGHIPGAYYLDLNQNLSSSVQSHGGRHPLPDWDTFTQTLNQLGIYSHPPNGPTQIVIYDDSRFAFAARLWWMLRYLGHEQVSILDGGIRAWESAGFSLSTEVPSAYVGNFEPRLQSDWIVDIDAVRDRKDHPNVTVIDSRSPERWRGEVEPIDPIAGSVPGSVNSFWKDISTADGQLKNTTALSEHWANLNPTDEIIVYCGSGVTACVNLFSLVMAGHPMHKLYPGGWSDWCSYRDLVDIKTDG